MAERVVFEKLTKEIEVEEENDMPTAPRVPKTKKQQVEMDATLALSDTLIATTATCDDVEVTLTLTPYQVARKEIDYYW